MVKASTCALLTVIAMSVSACSSPETPPAGTTASPAANPPASAAPATRTIAGYPEMPAINTELAGNVGDLEKDLRNLSAKQAAAASEFAEDLKNLMGDDAAVKPSVTALSRELAEVLPSATNREPLVSRLAELLFVAARRAPLAEDRFAALEGDVHKLLVEHGVPDARAKVVGGQVGAVARDARRRA